MNTTKIHCPHCGRCIAVRSTKDKTAETKILCNKPIKENENEMIEGLKCVKCKSIVYVTYKVKSVS
ncbi:MAG: hypothetical protein IJ371_05745 [Clostridia bacterium]|nr:hypothetical protein [Clostridia bacterium]